MKNKKQSYDIADEGNILNVFTMMSVGCRCTNMGEIILNYVCECMHIININIK